MVLHLGEAAAADTPTQPRVVAVLVVRAANRSSSCSSGWPVPPPRGRISMRAGNSQTQVTDGWFLHRNRRKTPLYGVLVAVISGNALGQTVGAESRNVLVIADHMDEPGRFSRRTLLTAAGAALVSADLAATACSDSTEQTHQGTRSKAGAPVDHRFDRMRDQTVGVNLVCAPLLAGVRHPKRPWPAASQRASVTPPISRSPCSCSTTNAGRRPMSCTSR